ncbi:MAG TPA: GTP cyclohydrolase II [Candidatus Poseidoniales archaeon]|nr:MAG TPA: GTP cyclohydrolase II [Candidatus Poseidoniales archaeon]|tara:strand:+ start:1231 stop:1845 length:615 start_codon:yes stop_codon:yes gene_type:complete
MAIQLRNDAEPVEIEADAYLPTESGNFRVRVTRDSNGKEHALLYTGDISNGDAPLVRIHSECLTGDAFGSMKCDCGPQLEAAMRKIQEEGCGAIVYLRQEGRGIGLHSKIQAYALQDIGYDTLDANLALGLPADAREYGIAAKMLKEAGVKKVRLMTNNPLKIQGLRNNGIHVERRIEHISGVSLENIHYLSTKGKRMGHILDI